MTFVLQVVSMKVVHELCQRYHGYGGAGGSSTYAFAVFEDGRPVAAYAWQPPPPGAAKNVCPEAPYAVLALSRMVACPRSERALKHISKPLREQMKERIDRGRWPVLVTYSDEGQGHTGYVYQCSGWEKTLRSKANVYVNEDGQRTSSYSNGKSGGRDLTRGGHTMIQRWEHWKCARGEADVWMDSFGWEREEIPGRYWKSGNQAYRYVRSADEVDQLVLL